MIMPVGLLMARRQLRGAERAALGIVAEVGEVVDGEEEEEEKESRRALGKFAWGLGTLRDQEKVLSGVAETGGLGRAQRSTFREEDTKGENRLSEEFCPRSSGQGQILARVFVFRTSPALTILPFDSFQTSLTSQRNNRPPKSHTTSDLQVQPARAALRERAKSKFRSNLAMLAPSARWTRSQWRRSTHNQSQLS